MAGGHRAPAHGGAPGAGGPGRGRPDPSAGPGSGSGTVAGFAAFGPATDPDRDTGRDAELHALLVDPAALGRGHGSRLLAAAADHLRADGFTAAVTWVPAEDEPLRRFLAGAGWAPDGASRDLDLTGDGSATLRQVRLHTDLTED